MTEEQARAAVRDMVQQAQDRAVAAQTMVTELEALEVVGRSGEGAEVVLGHTGGLRAVRLDNRLSDADLRTIERAIAEANSDAQFKLKEQVTDLADRHYSGEAASHFSQQYDALFPDARESDNPEPPNPGGVLR